MEESASLFRSRRRTASSFGRPLHRSRSLSTISTRHTDSANQLSKIRDHDLRANVDAKVQHLSRSFPAPKRNTAHHRSRSFSRQREDVSAGDDWQQSSGYSGWTRHRYTSAGNTIQPLLPLPLYATLGSPTALPQRKATRLLLKDAFDEEIQPTAGRSFDRITTMRDQLLREHQTAAGGHPATIDAADPQRRQDAGEPHRSSVRAELDSFAALLSKLAPAGSAAVGHPRSDTGEDYWTRLAHTRGDLGRLETLVSRTFGSPLHSVPGSSNISISNSPPPPTVTVEPVFIFHDKKEPLSSRGRDDVTEFITGDHADYRKSEAMAELAIKWAQERRWRLENELHRDRQLEGHPARHWHTHTTRYEDDLEPVSAAVIYTSPTTRYHRSATVDLHGISLPREPSSTVHGYKRSATASVTGLQHQQHHHHHADEQPASHWQPTTTFSTFRPAMSAARQKVRSVLAKHGRHLSRE